MKKSKKITDIPIGGNKHFTPFNQPLHRRNKGVITTLKETIGLEYGLDLTANEILDISQFMLELPEDLIKKLLKDNEQAMLVKIVAEKLLNKKNNIIMYDKILERLLKREGYRASRANPIEVLFEEGEYLDNNVEDDDGIDAMSEL